MIKERWHNIEMCCEDIEGYCNDILDRRMRRDELVAMVNDIKSVNDTIYTVCEADYCDHSSDIPDGYGEILEMLPDGSGLSIEETDRLKAHIEDWKRGK